MNPIRKAIYILSGTVFLILGTIGIFVPLLPTTPFWLLTCWFYLRSSERLYNRVMSNRYFGSYMKSYLEDKSMSIRSKAISLGAMWASILFTCIFVLDVWWLRILLITVTIAVSWHILSFPTRK